MVRLMLPCTHVSPGYFPGIGKAFIKHRLTIGSSNLNFQPVNTYKNNPYNEGASNKEQKRGLFVKALFGLSLVVTFKFAYDSTNAFWNYRKTISANRLQEVWNEAVVGTFALATKDADVQKHLGFPVRMGPPPLQSKSPLSLTGEGFVIGLIVGPLCYLHSFGEGVAITLEPSSTPSSSTPQITTSTEILYDEDRSRATVMIPPKKKIPELPAHIPASIRASLATKGEPVIVPNTPPAPSQESAVPIINLPTLKGFMKIKLPLVGSKGKGSLNIFVYTGKNQWEVKHAWVLDDDNLVVKEVVPNHIISGIDQ